MTSKPKTPVKDFFVGVALFVGVGLAALLCWIVAILAMAALVFFALTLFTDLSLGGRVVVSLVAAFGSMKVLGLISGVLDVFPESWLGKTKKTKPCPECGKNLRTALAQQCMHCGADWHS